MAGVNYKRERSGKNFSIGVPLVLLCNKNAAAAEHARPICGRISLAGRRITVSRKSISAYGTSILRKIRLMASGFEGFGSGCCAIHASSAASMSG